MLHYHTFGCFRTLPKGSVWFAPGNSASELKVSPRDAGSAWARHLKSGTSSFQQLKLSGVQVAASEGAAGRRVVRDSSHEQGSSSFPMLPCGFSMILLTRSGGGWGEAGQPPGEVASLTNKGTPCQACTGSCQLVDLRILLAQS